jgi:hypothetical protein
MITWSKCLADEAFLLFSTMLMPILYAASCHLYDIKRCSFVQSRLYMELKHRVQTDEGSDILDEDGCASSLLSFTIQSKSQSSNLFTTTMRRTNEDSWFRPYVPFNRTRPCLQQQLAVSQFSSLQYSRSMFSPPRTQPPCAHSNRSNLRNSSSSLPWRHCRCP